ncbi:MAG: hypothetical protein GYA88_04460 [Clostridiales bacterium]|nr:hypothetical protein [Clostridiales bacterium]
MKNKTKSVLLAALIFIGIFALIAAGGALEAKAQPAATHVCCFFSPEGKLLASVEVAEGANLVPPLRAPEIEGMRFMHWYLVDVRLEGDSGQAYMFDSPVTEPLYLMPRYEPEQAEEPDSEEGEAQGAAEEPAAEETPAEEAEAEEPADEEPADEEAAAEEAAEEPSAEESENGEPAAEESGSEEAAAEEAATEEGESGKSLDEEAELEELTDEEPELEEPADEEPELEELTGEERRILLKEEIDATNPDRKISFYATWGEKEAPEIGDEITIHAELSGYEGLNFVIRWQVKYSAQEEWLDLDVTGDSYTFIIDLQNLEWLFRVAVDIIEAE